ncbi:MAG: hypothetical protein AAGI37_04270 [Planctomycetota bacterium]
MQLCNLLYELRVVSTQIVDDLVLRFNALFKLTIDFKNIFSRSVT